MELVAETDLRWLLSEDIGLLTRPVEPEVWLANVRERYAFVTELEVAAEEIQDLCGSVMLAIVRQRGLLPGGAPWVELRHATVWTCVDGLVEPATNYADIDQAREAAERLGGDASR